jgi:hypothetical protein
MNQTAAEIYFHLTETRKQNTPLQITTSFACVVAAFLTGDMGIYLQQTELPFVL